MVRAFDQQAALVLFSGGQDSTVCLAWALERFSRVETLGFHYGQRHAVEMTVRPRIRERLRAGFPRWEGRLGGDHVLSLDSLAQISDSALIREGPIAAGADGLPNTFVPGRNLIFFTLAAALAYRIGAGHLVGGMCETDFSGYPDCRDDTLKALQVALGLGLDRRMVIHAPLMWIDKAETFALARELGGEALLDIVVEDTHSCYLGERARRHAFGYGCGTCPACALRAAGWDKFTSQGRT